jgi:hypothetical protein
MMVTEQVTINRPVKQPPPAQGGGGAVAKWDLWVIIRSDWACVYTREGADEFDCQSS